MAKWLAEALANFPMSQHLVANIDATATGDTATVRAMFHNPLGMPDGATWFCGGYYNHELVRTPEGWKSARLIEQSSYFSDGRFAPSE